MNGHQRQRVSLSTLDACDPDFQRQARAWAGDFQSEIVELLAQSKSTVASRALMAEIDRILDRPL
jgi:hypothetical protein